MFPFAGAAAFTFLLCASRFRVAGDCVLHRGANRSGRQPSLLRSLCPAVGTLPWFDRLFNPSAPHAVTPVRPCLHVRFFSYHALALCIRQLRIAAASVCSGSARRRNHWWDSCPYNGYMEKPGTTGEGTYLCCRRPRLSVMNRADSNLKRKFG